MANRKLTQEDLATVPVAMGDSHRLAVICTESSEKAHNTFDMLKNSLSVTADLCLTGPRLIIGTTTLYRAYNTLFNAWISEQGTGATYGRLLKVLEEEVDWRSAVEGILDWKSKNFSESSTGCNATANQRQQFDEFERRATNKALIKHETEIELAKDRLNKLEEQKQ